MIQPSGFKSIKHPTIVFQLKTPLYRLKQAPLKQITEYLYQIGFHMSKSDNSLYIRSKSDKSIVIILYMDDLVIRGKNLADISNVKSLLSGTFEMKDMHEVHYLDTNQDYDL